MSYIQERYRPVPMTANQTVTTKSSGLGGFICITSGNITVTQNSVDTPTVILNAFPMLAGVYYPLVMINDTNGAVVALTNGASGTLLVD